MQSKLALLVASMEKIRDCSGALDCVTEEMDALPVMLDFTQSMKDMNAKMRAS